MELKLKELRERMCPHEYEILRKRKIVKRFLKYVDYSQFRGNEFKITIHGAFRWLDTPEGHDFWGEIYKQVVEERIKRIN